jgi:DNA-binding transcriptional MerR regulator
MRATVSLALECQVKALELALECRVYAGAVKIAELATRVGVPTSTVRYYERIGLLASPARTESGYRDYDDGAAARLLFISRGRRMGLSCDQITELLPIWGGTNCGAAHDRVRQLIEDKKAEIGERITELESFVTQLDLVRTVLDADPPPAACRADLSCCVPETAAAGPIAIELRPRHATASR